MSKSEVQVLDFDKICRLCLLEKRSMSSIFSKKKSDKKVPLPVRIMSCASLELYEGDGLPSSICNKCLLSVNQSYAFREQCEQADTTLRQYAQRLQEASEEASTCVGSSMRLPEAEDKSGEENPALIPIIEIKKEEEDKTDTGNPQLNDSVREEIVGTDSIFDFGSTKVEAYECTTQDESFERETINDEGEFKPVTSNGSEDGKKPQKRKKSAKTDSSDKDVSVGSKSKYRPCTECSKIVLKKNFSLHMRVHSGAMPHMCDICGRCFKWRRVLEGHKRTHTGEKPYLCNSCGKSFRSSSRLSDHSTVHTGKKSYVCELCATAFRDKKHLVRHLRTHTGEKPFKCGFCGRAFSNSWNLKEHTRRHTGELPHICPFCHQGFIRNKGLEDHLKTRHLDKQTVVAGATYVVNRPEKNVDAKPEPELQECPVKSKNESWKKPSSAVTQQLHGKPEVNGCPLCSFKCQSKNTLFIHMKNDHKIS